MTGGAPLKLKRSAVGVLVVLFCLCQLATFWLFPFARVVHEGHFYLSASIRERAWLNRWVGKQLHRFMKFVDEFGVEQQPPLLPHNTTLIDVARFRQLDVEHRYDDLAQACIDGLYALYPIRAHNAYYHGVRDAWAFWTLMMMQCSLRDCRRLPYDLRSFNLLNTNAWRGLSGSDDVLWATLMLVNQDDLVDTRYEWCGARGARQLYAEVTEL